MLETAKKSWELSSLTIEFIYRTRGDESTEYVSLRRLTPADGT